MVKSTTWPAVAPVPNTAVAVACVPPILGAEINTAGTSEYAAPELITEIFIIFPAFTSAEAVAIMGNVSNGLTMVMAPLIVISPFALVTRFNPFVVL